MPDRPAARLSGASAPIRSQGVPVVKPAPGPSFHGNGVRSGSRPRPLPGSRSSGRVAHLRLREWPCPPCPVRRPYRSWACRAASAAASPPRAPAPAPTRLAMRGRSWLPSTQFGQPPGGSAASYRGHDVGDAPRRSSLQQQKLEVERQLRAAPVAAVIGHQPLDRQVQLADQHAVADTRPAPRASPATTSCTSGRSAV